MRYEIRYTVHRWDISENNKPHCSNHPTESARDSKYDLQCYFKRSGVKLLAKPPIIIDSDTPKAAVATVPI